MEDGEENEEEMKDLTDKLMKTHIKKGTPMSKESVDIIQSRR